MLAFATDLAEHYSQIATYMRLLGMVPPSALPPRRRTAVELPASALPASALPAYVGVYQLDRGVELDVTMRDGALLIGSNTGGGGGAARRWPESGSDFRVKEADAQVAFARDANNKVAGLVLHRYGRDRPAKQVR